LGNDEHLRGDEVVRPLELFFFVDLLIIKEVFIMPKKSFLTTKQITLVAMFIAMAVILKSVLVIETGSFRFTFYDIPMMVIGIVFGPFIGGITGIIVDFFHMMFSPWAFTFSVFTLSNMVWAIIPGVLLFGKKLERNRLVITIVIASILAFGLNTIGIVQFQGMGAMIATLYYRIGVLLIKLPIQVMAIEVIYERVLIKQLNLIKTK
jgi:ECF transporter S component (folate family)